MVENIKWFEVNTIIGLLNMGIFILILPIPEIMGQNFDQNRHERNGRDKKESDNRGTVLTPFLDRYCWYLICFH